MQISEAVLTAQLLDELICMSAFWETEQITHGYRKNEQSDIEGNRIFLARENGHLLGYLMGQMSTTQQASSVMPAQTPCFEVEELYVLPDFRCKGIGRALFDFAEKTLREQGAQYLMLSTATKDYKRVLRFYIEEMGMEFWSARLFKKL